MSSSGGKKKHPLPLCRHCGCFCLAKELDAHNNGEQQTSPSSASSTNNTPKPSLVGGQERRRTARRSTRATPTTEENGEECRPNDCDGRRGFTHSRLPLIEPGKGLALREESHGDAEKWEKCFPVELSGWSRRHAALVSPEVLNAVGAMPRSAFLLLGQADEAAGDQGKELLTLWPCTEVPLMRIVLPHPMRSAIASSSAPSSSKSMANNAALLRLHFIRHFGPPLSQLLLQPDLQATSSADFPLHCWAKLSKLSHFPLFLRSYFANALIRLAHPSRLQVHYYGHKLWFGIVGQTFQTAGEVENGGLERQLQAQCSLSGVDRDEEELAQVHRVPPFCKFTVDWSAVAEEEERKDEAESLL